MIKVYMYESVEYFRKFCGSVFVDEDGLMGVWGRKE